MFEVVGGTSEVPPTTSEVPPWSKKRRFDGQPAFSGGSTESDMVGKCDLRYRYGFVFYIGKKV